MLESYLSGTSEFQEVPREGMVGWPPPPPPTPGMPGGLASPLPAPAGEGGRAHHPHGHALMEKQCVHCPWREQGPYLEVQRTWILPLTSGVLCSRGGLTLGLGSNPPLCKTEHGVQVLLKVFSSSESTWFSCGPTAWSSGEGIYLSFKGWRGALTDAAGKSRAPSAGQRMGAAC